MGRKDREFWESARLNNATFNYFYRRICEIGAATIKWGNCPLTVNQRYSQLALIADGRSVFFKDEDIGFLNLRVLPSGNFDEYGEPMNRRAYGVNGYNKELTADNSVIIYNNYMRTSSRPDIELFARKLYTISRAIDLNVNAQKTPLLIECPEEQRLTLLNMYKNYDGNAPIIYGSDKLNPQQLKAYTTNAPYVADRLYQLQVNVWNEVLTYWGISNVSYNKKERVISDEVNRGMGGVMANRAVRLNEQIEATKHINEMFGLQIEPYFDDGCLDCAQDLVNQMLEEQKEDTEE